MRKLWIAATAAAFALGAAAEAPAQAQQKAPAAAPAKKAAPPASSVPPGAIAAAKEILAMKNAYAVYQGAVVTTIQNVKNALLQTNINLQKDIEEVSLKIARDLSGKESELGEAMAIIYANHFSEQELKDLVAFYKSPLGKKSLETEPKAIESSLGYMRAWGEDLAQEINVRYRDELKKRGKDL
jgi:hypothetical protein